MIFLSYDADYSLIVVTPMGGISHLLWKPKYIKTVNLCEEGGIRNSVSALCPDGDGKVWVGSRQGLNLYDPSTGSLSDFIPQARHYSEITNLDCNGDSLWIGTRRNGLLLYIPSTGRIKQYTYDDNTPYSLISNNINKIYHTRYGEVFVLTGWGLCRYSRESDNFTTLPEIASHMSFVTMQEDSHGGLWMATGNGLYRRERPGTRFVAFNSKEVGRSHVPMMFLDSRGTLWVVTQDNRVLYFDEEAGDFRRLKVSVPNECAITFMEEDSDGNLWIGTSGGLAKADTARNLTYYSFRYDTDELPSVGVSCRLSDGGIIFGSGNGFKTFNPNEMKPNNGVVKVYVQSLVFPYHDNSDEELRRLGLDVLLYTRKEIKLPYVDNTFTLRLSASRTHDMPPVYYEYMLEGLDKGWITGADREVTYNDLRPGTYTFLLRPSAISDSETRRLSIVIMPPWYRTWIAYCVYGLVGLIVVWVGVRYARRRIRRHYQNHIDEMRNRKNRELLEAKMRFFVNLVHEIRTPLTLISLPLEQMAESVEEGEATPESNERHIRSMQRNVNYLLGITNQLLDFRKAEQDSEVKLSLTRCNLNSLIEEICGRFDHPMQSVGKKISLEMPEETVFADIDVGKTDRVIMNLIGNALKYSRHDVVITLHSPANGKTCISVADDGPGIPPNEREKIFNTYYQIESDNVGATLGTGLGLAYAKLIAKAHNGDIMVGDNANGGAVFSLWLPINASQPARAELGAVDDRPIEEKPDAVANKITLLLVDDNRELLTTVAEALRNNYNVIAVEDGTEGLDLLEARGDIDVIVSDFMMPMMSGTEFCRRVKGDIRFSHIPFIILTAKTDADAKVEGMEVGADCYMEKPFTIKQLTLQIANILHTRELFHARMSSGRVIPSGEEVIAESSHLNRLDAEFLNTLNNYIRENICDEELSIDVMARQMNMSRSSFYRKLKAVTGLTPVDYLKNFRLDYSARLLLDGVRVTEVAMMAGFTSSSYFAKCFKAKFGMIPKEYTSANQKG